MKKQFNTFQFFGLITCVILLLVLTLGGCKKKSDPEPEPTKSELVKAAIEPIRMATELELGHEVPSINIYLQTPDEIAFASATANGVAPLTPATFFRFASNTKTFTSTAILNMYEDGWLDIYNKITDLIPGYSESYVPETPGWEIPYKDEITIELLLQHAAGVYDVDNDPVPGFDGKSYIQFMYDADSAHQFTVAEMVDQLVINNLSYFKPDSGYHYSNTGFAILSDIIARIYSLHAGTQKSCTDYLEDYIYGANSPVPLNLHFPWQASDVYLENPHVSGIIYYQNIGKVTCGSSNMSAHMGEGNGWANFVDLNQFVRTLMTGNNVLTQQTVTLMQTDYSPYGGKYGLGCTHTANLGYGHNGCIRGYLTLMLYDPDVEVSLIALLPMVDQTSEDNFTTGFMAMYEAAWAARAALGYPGKPDMKEAVEVNPF